jgi:ribosomal protein RSM22 (predicted rRNA methylase)
MRFPEALRQAIADITAEVEPAALARASAELTERYRNGTPSKTALTSQAHRAAYLTLRLPATFAATRRVLEEARRLAPDLAVYSMLDLGAGPGTALWAAVEVFPELTAAVLVERDHVLIDAGLRLAQGAVHPVHASAEWIHADLASSTVPELKDFDLVVFAYVLGELNPAAQQAVARLAWSKTEKLLAIVEPGTPRGFENIIRARTALTSFGAHIVAPCPRVGEHPCPMQDGDWCHFSQRLERTAQHRRLKGGELGYEDEKFSYVILSKRPVTPARARIVRHPILRKGHVQLKLCTPAGLQQLTVTRTDKEKYRAARKAEWGDGWGN